MAVSTSASAQTAPPTSTTLITLDENGNGTFLFDGTTSAPISAELLPNSTGGPASALTLGILANIVPGDVVLLEADGSSDVIRFTGTEGITRMLFFSDNADGSDALADTGLPSQLSTNVVRLSEVGTEGNNGAFYTPTANQPGFLNGLITLSYHFVSDSPVPEPSTWAMMLLGFGAIGLAMRRSREPAAAQA